MKISSLDRLSYFLFVGVAGCSGGGHAAPEPAAPALASSATPVAAPVAVDASVDLSTPPSASSVARGPEAKPFPLPGATAPASLDYIAVDRAGGKVWIPVGGTGSVDVFAIDGEGFTRVDGFATAERDVRGTKRTVGPSAVSLGDGVAYVGNRATSEVCAVDMKTLKLGKCIKLQSPTDGVAYVAAAKEVWVTTPRDKTLTVLDASRPDMLKAKAIVKMAGEPEGYATDDAHGLFFTNLEDEGSTIVVDVKTHKPKAKWSAACGTDGPRGLAYDAARSFLFVACTDHVQVLDAAHDGARLGKIDTGGGVDNLDYLETKGLLFAAAGKDAKLTVIQVDDKGQLTVASTFETSPGARNAVADAHGKAYVADARGARLLVLGN